MKEKVVFLPERLKEAVGAANMTQAELAKKVGVSVSSIRRYMSGAPIPQRRVRAEIGRVLNVNTQWLGGHSDSMERTYVQKHLDKLGSMGKPLRQDDQLFELAIALADLSEQDRKEIARLLGTPTDLKPLEVRKVVRKK